MDVNWTAVIVGAVLAYLLGWAWYSQKMFGRGWVADNNLDMNKPGRYGMWLPMLAQAGATFLLAWVIGVTEKSDDLPFAILIALTIAGLMKAGGLFVGKSKRVIIIETGYVLAMVVVMLLTHMFL